MKLLLGTMNPDYVIQGMRRVGEYYAKAKLLGFSDEDAKTILDAEVLKYQASVTQRSDTVTEAALRILIEMYYAREANESVISRT